MPSKVAKQKWRSTSWALGRFSPSHGRIKVGAKAGAKVGSWREVSSAFSVGVTRAISNADRRPHRFFFSTRNGFIFFGSCTHARRLALPRYSRITFGIKGVVGKKLFCNIPGNKGGIKGVLGGRSLCPTILPVIPTPQPSFDPVPQQPYKEILAALLRTFRIFRPGIFLPHIR